MAVTITDVVLAVGKDMPDASLATLDGLKVARVRRVDHDYPVQDSVGYVVKQRQITLEHTPDGGDTLIDWYDLVGEWLTIKFSRLVNGNQKARTYSAYIQDVVCEWKGANALTYHILLVMPKEEVSTVVNKKQ